MRRGRVGQVGYAKGTDESKRNERDGWGVRGERWQCDTVRIPKKKNKCFGIMVIRHVGMHKKDEK